MTQQSSGKSSGQSSRQSRANGYKMESFLIVKIWYGKLLWRNGPAWRTVWAVSNLFSVRVLALLVHGVLNLGGSHDVMRARVVGVV